MRAWLFVESEIEITDYHIQNWIFSYLITSPKIIIKKSGQHMPIVGGQPSTGIFDQFVHGNVQFFFDHVDENPALGFGHSFECIFVFIEKLFLHSPDVRSEEHTSELQSRGHL